MYGQQQTTMQETTDKLADFGFTTDDFKGVKPELWVEIAVRQCLAAQLVDTVRYALAVTNLEAVLVTKLDADFKKDCNTALNEAIAEKGQKNITLADQAAVRFRALIKLIDRKKDDERTLSI